VAVVSISRELHTRLREDLRPPVEGAGFFLAEYQERGRVFKLEEWRVVPSSGFESRSRYHLVLADDVRAAMIKWAWDSGACLVEAHSHHTDDGPACFSPSDMYGLREWVPHLWWRLRARPYAAIVIDGETFDSLAWIDAADRPEQVTSLEVEGLESIRATERTMTRQKTPTDVDHDP
jgi:hypothetical protein